jgi:hypothetical protein
MQQSDLFTFSYPSPVYVGRLGVWLKSTFFRLGIGEVYVRI